MRIRWKLLILLLLIALTPLALVSTLHRRATLGLGREMASRAGEALIDRAGRALQQLVDDQAAVIRQEGQRIHQALRAQAFEVERCLAAPPPVHARPYYTQDYDRGINLPAGMAPSARHDGIRPDNSTGPISITLNEQVFVLAPGVSREAVADDVARLTAMLPMYRLLYEGAPELIYWQYTSLDNGVHSCYPGHGGSPAEYDPRKREWYTLAQGEEDVQWCAPYVDVSPRQVILTAAQRVHRPDGSFAGVTAIDIVASDIVRHLPLPSFLAKGARTMLVAAEPPPGGAEPHLRIVARPDYASRGRRWDAPQEFEWLAADDTAQLREMTQEMLAEKSGVRRMPQAGRMGLWAYGPLASKAKGVGVVMIVPYDDVVAEAREAEAYVLARTAQQLRLTSAVGGGVILVVAMIAFVYSRRVTRPIRELADAAGRIARGELDTRVAIRTHDELGELGRAFNEMVPQLRDRLKIRHSLSLAMEVQQRLLPAHPPRIPGLDVAGKSIYCDETGGDYYDFLDLSKLGPNRLGIAVGDVAGHGIAAALLMATARALLRSRASQPGSLAQLMRDINAHLAEDTPTNRFMTLAYLLIDSHARQARWVCAGHDPAIAYEPAGDTFREWEGGDIPLGIQAAWPYREHGPVALQPGQIIVIGTDGIWETRNPAGEMFGKDGLRSVIRRSAERSAEEISLAITEALAAFRQTAPQEDDVTLVVVKVLP